MTNVFRKLGSALKTVAPTLAAVVTGGASDRADARARQVAMRDRAPFVLAAVTVAGFFAIFATLVFVDVPAGSREAMLLMIGAVTGALASVTSCFFGSFTGSKRKEEQVGDLLRRLGDRAP